MLSNMECFVLRIIYMYSNKETNWPLQIKLFCLKAGLVLFGEHEKSHLRNVLSMLQVKSNLRSICSNLGQFDFFLFLRQTKKIFLAPSIFSSSSFFSLSPLYLPHLLFPPSSTNIPTPILFISMLTCTV